jgi:hypothetical protein
MACSDEDHGRSRRSSAEDRGWSHKSDTWWPGDREVGWCRVRSASCTWRRGARVSWLSLKTKVDGCEWFGLKTTRTIFAGLASKPVVTVFGGLASKPAVTDSRFGPQNRRLRFGDLGSKSPRRFLGLGLKTKQASVCRLRHKTDEGRSARDTHRDLVACFAWKQVWLGFLSLA